MATLNWTAIQDFFDTFTINVFKCKLCTEFATTHRIKGIAHIVNDHASVQQDGVVVVFHSNSQDASISEADQLEEMRTQCEHALLKRQGCTQDGATQTDVTLVVNAATEIDSSLQETSGISPLMSVEKNVAEVCTAESVVIGESNEIRKEDGSKSLLDVDQSSSDVMASIRGGDSDDSDDDNNGDDYNNEEVMDTEITSESESLQELDDVNSESQEKELHDKRLVKKDQPTSSAETDPRNSQNKTPSRQAGSRAGLRSPDKRKRKVFHDCVQEDHRLVLKETGVRNSDSPLKCDKCEFTTDHAKGLARHELTHKSKQSKSKKVLCEKCKKQFENQKMFNQHRLSCNKKGSDTENTTDVDKDETEKRKSDDDDGAEKHVKVPDSPKTCKICSFVCKSEKGYKIHMHKHAEQRKSRSIACDDCGKLFTTTQGMVKHRRDKWCRKGRPKNAYKRYRCNICDKQFHNKGIYEEHLTVHSAVRKHNCEHCQKCFKTARALKRHNVSHSSEPYKCTLCDFTTSWKGSLRVHYVGKHDSESRELQKCPHCPFTTRSKLYISRHIMLHSEDRPYICEHCGKSFKSDIVLRAHLETHDNKTFPCDQCDYVGGTKAAIYNHRQCHIPKEQMQFKCDQCDWVGKRSTEFQIHLRKHSAMKLFRCGHCGHSYKHKHGLTRHLKEKHIVQEITAIREVVFPDLDLETQEATMALSSLPVAQFFEISTEILTDP
ncbi:uncharacterized protein [Amphiura filiformis]|uniref:uncharacterized protein n=1 Tax=Amphiura filiformis TaxID=82378 RepID=UPI003B2220D3